MGGAVVDDPEADIDTHELEFTVAGETWRYREKAYVVLHKPSGYECSHRPSHHPSVFTLLPAPLRERGIQCVGRLDQETTGLLLLSDDGAFLHRMTSPKKRVAKVYRAVCAEPVDASLLQALRSGVQLNDEPAPLAALACEALGAHTVRLALSQGKYHQVRRMIAAAGNHVDALHREAIGGFVLPDSLAPGAWRWLNDAELGDLEQTWPSATS